MIVPDELLLSCGLKPNHRKDGKNTWTKYATNSLLDTIIFEYDPSAEQATVFVQEPRITRVDGLIIITSIEDFMDFSWEFYVKYIANMNYKHPEWDGMAKIHKKPLSNEIDELVKQNERKQREYVSQYKHLFTDDSFFDKFQLVFVLLKFFFLL